MSKRSRSLSPPTHPETKCGVHGSVLDHQFLGLSPTYWSYNPMLIGDILRLGFINGVDCMISPPITDDKRSSKNSCSKYNNVVPVSKCEIRGVIVYADHKSNKSSHYVLDDGTGLIDCVSWSSVNSIYWLPSLDDYEEENMKSFQVGDTVRIMGKLKCIFIEQEKRQRCDEAPPTKLIRTIDGIKWENRVCVREIVINVIDYSDNQGCRNSGNTMTEEIMHWLKCVQFGRRLHSKFNNESNNKKSKHGNDEIFTEVTPLFDEFNGNNFSDSDYAIACKEVKRPLFNSCNFIHRLGTKFSKHLLFPSHLNELNHMKEKSDLFLIIFGQDCKCQLNHKIPLLYCHCLATTETLDPSLKFRDVLLEKLLKMEHRTSNLPHPSDSNSSVQSPCLGKSMNSLQFSYKALLDDKSLQEVATTILSGTSHRRANITRLFVNTFKCLRQDGIIYLWDVNKDIYILLSKDLVLVPYTRQCFSSNFGRKIQRSNTPFFLSHVPLIKLHILIKVIENDVKNKAKIEQTKLKNI